MERDALESISEAVLAIAAEREVEPVLRRLVHSARELAGARYAALGIPDGEGAFAQFITAGMSDELIAAMGPLPRTHGLLGAMLESPEPHRTPDIREHPRFRGWWPSAHPQMRSFLGVPIAARGSVIAAFYLTDKDGAEHFSAEDQRLIEMLAAHAAVAIENARLTERSRELSIVEERNRLARELHDSVSQKLFGLVLTAEAASTLLGREDGAAGEQVARLGELAQEALAELRELIFELRPPSLEDEGLAATAAQGGRHARARARARDRGADRGRGELPARERVRGPARGAGGAQQRAPARRGGADRAADGGARRPPGGDGGRRRRRLRPRGAGRALAAARPDVDGGARTGARRHAGGRLPARRGHDGHARGAAMIRVLIADDHAVVRQGLRTFLDLQDDIEVVAEAADGAEALAAAEAHAPDVVLIDLVMPNVDGIEALRGLRERVPAARAIVLSSFIDDAKLFPAVRAGAAGYLLKDIQPQELVEAIRTVHGGGALLHPKVASRLLEEMTTDPLTPREREVLSLHRPRDGEQGDRARAVAVREDGQGPREQHPGQARRHRPHAGGAVRGARRARGPGALAARRSAQLPQWPTHGSVPTAYRVPPIHR